MMKTEKIDYLIDWLIDFNGIWIHLGFFIPRSKGIKFIERGYLHFCIIIS